MHAAPAEVEALHWGAAAGARGMRAALERLLRDQRALPKRAAAGGGEAPLDVERRVAEREQEVRVLEAAELGDDSPSMPAGSPCGRDPTPRPAARTEPWSGRAGRAGARTALGTPGAGRARRSRTGGPRYPPGARRRAPPSKCRSTAAGPPKPKIRTRASPRPPAAGSGGSPRIPKCAVKGPVRSTIQSAASARSSSGASSSGSRRANVDTGSSVEITARARMLRASAVVSRKPSPSRSMRVTSALTNARAPALPPRGRARWRGSLCRRPRARARSGVPRRRPRSGRAGCRARGSRRGRRRSAAPPLPAGRRRARRARAASIQPGRRPRQLAGAELLEQRLLRARRPVQERCDALGRRGEHRLELAAEPAPAAADRQLFAPRLAAGGERELRLGEPDPLRAQVELVVGRQPATERQLELRDVVLERRRVVVGSERAAALEPPARGRRRSLRRAPGTRPRSARSARRRRSRRRTVPRHRRPTSRSYSTGASRRSRFPRYHSHGRARHQDCGARRRPRRPLGPRCSRRPSS